MMCNQDLPLADVWEGMYLFLENNQFLDKQVAVRSGITILGRTHRGSRRERAYFSFLNRPSYAHSPSPGFEI